MTNWLDDLVLEKAQKAQLDHDGRWSGAALDAEATASKLADAMDAVVADYNKKIPKGAPAITRSTDKQNRPVWSGDGRRWTRIQIVGAGDVEVLRAQDSVFEGQTEEGSVSRTSVKAWAVNGAERVFADGRPVEDFAEAAK
jgi:hypothetical protein